MNRDICDLLSFIHRFGSSLNAHVHFRVCAVDGVPRPLNFPEAGVRGRQQNAANLTYRCTA
jgi:hypothetical protein